MAAFLKYISSNISLNEGTNMMNRLMKTDTAFATQAAEGARVILDAVFAGEGGSVNRSCISSEQ